MHVFSSIKFKLNFQEPKTTNPWYGLDTSMVFFFIWTHGEEKLKEMIADFKGAVK